MPLAVEPIAYLVLFLGVVHALEPDKINSTRKLVKTDQSLIDLI